MSPVRLSGLQTCLSPLLVTLSDLGLGGGGGIDGNMRACVHVTFPCMCVLDLSWGLVQGTCPNLWKLLSLQVWLQWETSLRRSVVFLGEYYRVNWWTALGSLTGSVGQRLWTRTVKFHANSLPTSCARLEGILVHFPYRLRAMYI